MRTLLLTIMWSIICGATSYAQTAFELDYEKIYAYGMDANVSPILKLLEEHSHQLSKEDQDFRDDFFDRFYGEADAKNYDSSSDPVIDQLLSHFREYWRISLLDPTQDYMMNLGRNVMPLLMQHYPDFKGPQQRDSLGHYLAAFIRSRGFNTTERIDPKGRLVDLQIWQTETDSLVKVRLGKSEEVEVKLVFMDDFLTLGWMEYATLGQHHPGGWTTEEAIYCVRGAYDLESEHFTVSYLTHEARHFLDKQAFADLTDQELEYRAKLTELSHAKSSLYHLIGFFIANANPESTNGHQLANHQLISSLSIEIYDMDYQPDVSEWKQIPVKKIQKTASKLLVNHTRLLEARMVKAHRNTDGQ